MKVIKKIIKYLIYKIPEIVALCGIIALLLVAWSEEYSILTGEGTPNGILTKIFYCFLAIGIGSLLARFREAINSAKRR